MKSSFDTATHYFRAFAILAVMACHYCAMANHDTINRVFFTASTHFFLFISGYLCQFIHERKHDSALEYYRKKLTNVIVPYILFTTVLSLTPAAPKGILHNLFYGSAQAPYWYIPFVMTLFIVSPALCRASNRVVLGLFGIAFICSVIVPDRQFPLTWNWPGVAKLYTYFVPYYLLGFVYARHKELADKFLARFMVPLSILAALLYLPIVFGGNDFLVSLQRFVMIAAVLGCLRKIESKRIPLLDMTATTSFTLYFVHDLYFHGVLKLIPVSFRSGFVEALVFLPAAILLVYLSAFVRKRLGRFSRPLIGS